MFAFLENVLQGIAIDERVLMMWNKHSYGVLDVLIDNTNVLSEEAGNATLRLASTPFYAYGVCPTRCARIYNRLIIRLK